MEIKDNPLLLFLNFKKEDFKTKILVKGSKNRNKEFKINYFHIKDRKNQILFNDLLFDNKYKLIIFKNVELKYIDAEEQKNEFKIVNKKKNYILSGKTLNVNKLIDELINSDDSSQLSLIEDKFNLKVNINKVRLNKNYFINDLYGNISFLNNEIIDADLGGSFSEEKKIKFTVNTKKSEKITTFYSDDASPFIQRYKFIKGFEEGSLDFNSSKVGNKINSNLKILILKSKKFQY